MKTSIRHTTGRAIAGIVVASACLGGLAACDNQQEDDTEQVQDNQNSGNGSDGTTGGSQSNDQDDDDQDDVQDDNQDDDQNDDQDDDNK